MTPRPAKTGPVLFAYDGSALAASAIEQAGVQLAAGRDALAVCVWQAGDVGFVPPEPRHLDADQATEVRQAAEETAAAGAALATAAGFDARPLAVNAAPTWKGILHAAEEHHASLVVIGTHRHPGLLGHLAGSVASAVITHATIPILLIHPRP